jgi:hypothetical protein
MRSNTFGEENYLNIQFPGEMVPPPPGSSTLWDRVTHGMKLEEAPPIDEEFWLGKKDNPEG